jgi:hypothetical protein
LPPDQGPRTRHFHQDSNIIPSRDDARAMRDLGAAAFLHSNERNLLKTAAEQAAGE